MIILTKEKSENNEQITNIIGNEKKLILSTIESQKTLKNMLLDYMQKLADSTDNVDSNISNTILNILQDAKNVLNIFSKNQELLNSLLELLDNICNKDKNIDLETINNFNATFFEKSETVSKNTIQIENFLSSISKFSKFTFCGANDNCIGNTALANETEKNKILEKPLNKDLAQLLEVLEMHENKDSTQSISTTNIVENTLIISESKGKVFLPYTLSSLNDILKNNSDKYSSVKDIVEKKYTLHLSSFKNPAIARFREAFKLIRKREKKSIREAFDLGIELLFNYNLHPAIIAACKNLDELDIYLECLENNETNKFDCFKIIFDIAPVSTKTDKKYQF